MTPLIDPTLQRKVTPRLRILIVRVGAMGDVIHALPAVAALREALPEAHIDWAIEPRWAALLRVAGTTTRDVDRMPLVDGVHLVEAKQWNKHPLSLATARSIAALRRELRAARYDVAVDLQGTLRSAVIARMSGAREVIGSAAPREALARRLYRTCVPRVGTHVVDQARELVQAALLSAGAVGTLPPDDAVPLGLSPLPRDAEAEAWWIERRAEVCGRQPIALLAATAGWGAKEWPPENFAALAAALVNRGYCVLLNTVSGAPDGATSRVLASLAQNHAEQAGGVHTIAATIPQLIAATRDVQAVVAGDTGPLHLAAALGVATVGLFGPTAPERTGPRGRAINLRHRSSVTDHRRHGEAETGLCMLTIDEVLAAFERAAPPR